MKHLLSILLGIISTIAWSQDYYLIHLKPKNNTASYFNNPTSMLTQKALDRRLNRNINVDDKDVPIDASIIQQIKNLNLTYVGSSKWLNNVMVAIDNEDVKNQVQNLSFVQTVQPLFNDNFAPRHNHNPSKFQEFNARLTNFDYGYSSSFIDQLNLSPIHQAGYTAQNILIGVIDSGFPGVDFIDAFAALRNENRIIDSKNFVNSNSIYDMHSHGTVVLATMAAKVNGSFVGSAPDANYALYVSEDASQETPKELMYWIQAAERADSIGVDVINTSLGYTTFDDDRYDFTYDDMDGNTTLISKGAKIAASRGIFLLNAMGNDGANDWHYVSAPADVAEMFSIGAIDLNLNPAYFTSFGPNSANKNKPNVSALGVSTPTYSPNGNITYSNGTSLASPVLAGAVASLMSAAPTMPLDELKLLIENAGHLYPVYDVQLGFGVPNFGVILEALKSNELEKNRFKIYPNPSSNYFKVDADLDIKNIQLLSLIGQVVKEVKDKDTLEVKNVAKGIYILKIVFEDDSQSHSKVIIK